MSEAKQEGEAEEKAECRGCGMILRGRPYCYGGSAYHPQTGERAKANYYGGFVCSQECDFRSSLRLEQSMPGASGEISRTLSCYANDHYKNNWR